MKRAAGGLVVVLVSVLLPASAAQAADTTVVVHGLDFPDESAGFGAADCTEVFGDVEDYPALHLLKGPGTVPLGERALRVAPETTGDAFGIYTSTDDLRTTTVMNVKVHASVGQQGRAIVYYIPNGGPQTEGYVGIAELEKAGNSWSTINQRSLTYDWWEADFQQSELGFSAGSATIAGFLPTHGTTGEADLLTAFGCDGQAFSLDAIRIGSAGNTTTYDIEGLQPKATAKASKKTITAGEQVQITGTLKAGETVYDDATVHLEAKPAATDEFVEVGDTQTQDGKATLAQKPMVNTQYRWRYDGTEGSDPATSAPVNVSVRTALTAKLADSSVKKGKEIKLSGVAKPGVKGATVTLWRKTGKKPEKLDTAKVSAGGDYSFSVKATSTGKWALYVTIPKTSTNAAGKSPTRTAKVT